MAHGHMTWVPFGATLAGTEGGVLSPPFPNPAKLKFRLTALDAPTLGSVSPMSSLGPGKRKEWGA